MGDPFGTESWDGIGSREAFQETQRILATLPGGSELLDWFGGVSSFHDAEVVRLDLDREGTCRLQLMIVGRLKKALVTFVLTDWIDASIAGFSKQNVIGELLLHEPGDRAVEPWERGVGLLSGDHEITLMPIYGANGTIRATISKIELVELQQREP